MAWSRMLDQWTAEEHAEMTELYHFFEVVLPQLGLVEVVRAMSCTRCLPLAYQVFLHVAGSWYARAVGEKAPNLPERETELPSPVEYGAYDLDHEGWSKMEALVLKEDGGCLILMEHGLPLPVRLASWLHESLHVAFDARGESEAESELRVCSIEHDVLAQIEQAGILPFSLAEQIWRAGYMANYWAEFLDQSE